MLRAAFSPEGSRLASVSEHGGELAAELTPRSTALEELLAIRHKLLEIPESSATLN